MAMYVYEKEAVFPYYKMAIDYYLQQRDSLPSTEIKIAINMNILLDAACYLEGILENRAKDVLRYYYDLYMEKVDIPEFEVRKPITMFFNAVTKDLEQRISKCTGIAKYDEIFTLLLGKSFKQKAS